MTRIGISAPRSCDEVEPVGADERVEAGGAELADLLLERVHPPRREDPRHQAAVHGVHGRVLEQHHARRQLHARLDDLEDVAPGVGERLPVDERLLHVGVAGQRPDVVALVVVDRRLVPEPAVRRVRVGVDPASYGS